VNLDILALKNKVSLIYHLLLCFFKKTKKIL